MISGELTGNGLAARPGDGLLSRDESSWVLTASRGVKPCCLTCLDRKIFGEMNELTISFTL